MLVLGLFKNKEQAINQLIALGEFHFAFALAGFDENIYEDLT